MSPKRQREPAPADEVDFTTFETAFSELQQVVEQLEDGSLELERAVELFERGNRLVQVCDRLVANAELRVTRLSAESASPLSDAPAEPASPLSDAPAEPASPLSDAADP